MKRKIQLHLFIIAGISILLTVVLSLLFFYSTLTNQVEVDLAQTASVLVKMDENQIITNSLIPDQIRLTLINDSGDVLYDSAVEEGNMANHLDREEISEVLEDGVGLAIRKSDTVGKNTIYYAVRNKDGHMLRLSKETDNIWRVFVSALPAVVIVSIFIFILILWLSSRLTKRVIEPIEEIGKNLDLDIPQNSYEELSPFFHAIADSNKEKENRILELRSQTKQIELIIENMLDGLIIVDGERKILMVNSSAKKFLKAPTTDVIGKNYKYLSRLKELEFCINRAFEDKSTSIEIPQGDKWLRFLCNPVYADGDITGAICFIFDITSQKESELIRQEFSANVTHELKTPLTTIRGYAELLENDMVKKEDQKRFAQTINREAMRLLSIITDILEISKLESTYTQKEQQVCSLKDIVEKIIAELDYPAKSKNISIIKKYDDTLDYSILGVRDQLEQLVRNLCDNAIRYNVDGGTVTIELDKMDTNTILRVKNTGIGIPEENRTRIFERFYTVDKSHSKLNGGTGLGLSIVKHVSENHGATISVSKNDPQGTIFSIIFPS